MEDYSAVVDQSPVEDYSAVVNPIQKLVETLIGKNYEQPISTKLVPKRDPQRRIELCIAPGVPAEGRYTRGKMVPNHHPIRRAGLNYRGSSTYL